LSRRQLWEALAGGLLLLLALGAALLSRGVADAAAQFRHQQAAWEQGLAPHDPETTGLAGALAADLLGIRARSRVVAAYVDYRRDLWYAGGTLFRQTEARSQAIDRIGSLRTSLASAADRSRVDVTLCVLSAANAAASGSQRQHLLGSAVGFCRDAVVEDPANAEAKHDLELLLEQATKAQEAQARSREGGARRSKLQDKPAATPHTQRERRIGY
jgi:hypothetical protein